MQNNTTEKKSAFSARMTFVEGAREMSRSAYNLVIGLMLVWGFGLNYLICKFLGPQLVLRAFMSGNIRTVLLVGLIAYLVLAMTGSRLVRSTSVAVSFLGYNMIVIPVGFVLMFAIVGAGYDPYLVTRAAMMTACISILIMMAAAIKAELFLRMGPALLVSLFAVIIVELISMLIFGYVGTVIDYLVVLIFGLFIGFDWARAGVIQRTTSNAIAVAASLYLDILNVFLRILSILGRRKN